MGALTIETRVSDRPRRRWAIWTGRGLSALTILAMLLSAAMKFMAPPLVIEQFVGKFGYREGILFALGVLEVSCVVLYAIPRTAVLGAVLVTGYLGGAIATHARIGDAFIVPLALGVAAWAGLYLREERLGALLPLRLATRSA